MANGAGTALGLSIGATTLAAVTGDHSVTRKPVLTLYRERPPEVGLPSENPRLDQPGLVMTGFVNRIGDPRPVVAVDGSLHRSEELIADALRALAYAATGGRALPENIAVTYPAHWESQAVDTLGAALSDVSDWSHRAQPLMLIPDAAATLLAVRTNPGLPPHGTVAVCDFGGSGTNITLMAAGGDYQALAPTVRNRDFSGDLIDQALLNAVIANMPTTVSFDPSGTAAIGSLSRLRTGCRGAKERLSSSTVTTLSDGLTGAGAGIRLDRHELDDAIRLCLDNFLVALEETLADNGIRDLVAVVSAGGGANIPAVTTTLSRHLRVPVVTTARPQLTAAIGSALRVARGPGENSATLSASPAPVTATVRPPQGPISGHVADRREDATATAQASSAETATGTPAARAWSATAAGSAAPYATTDPNPGEASAKIAETAPSGSKRKRLLTRWYGLPAMALVATVVAVLLLVGTAVAVELGRGNKPATTPSPGVSTSQAAPAPPDGSATAQPASPTQVAPPPTTDTSPPAETRAPAASAPAPTRRVAPPAAVAAPGPVIARTPPIPRIPPIPGINEPIPGLDRVNQIIQGIEGDLGVVAQSPRQ